MANYCIDTSGLSNPWETFPEDIYESLWIKIYKLIQSQSFCCNVEIFNEMGGISGNLGDCLKITGNIKLFEVGNSDWEWKIYIQTVNRMNNDYKHIISEYNRNRKNTVGLNDISIIALAKTLELPLVSMERPTGGHVTDFSVIKKLRIPDICKLEGVKHLNFNDLLRSEKIRI